MILNTALGKIEGEQKAGLMAFRGIPYAQAPLGELRWMPPQAYGGWAGVRDGRSYPNRCFQPPMPESLSLGEIPGQMAEDCLYLNVYTPQPDDKRRPVLAWIHGGGYIQGSANDFDPDRFVRNYDVVLVAMNYRLGMLGFLDLSRFGEAYAGSASIGFQDQILALQWVREHIADYGGDPDNLTICGGSAGGGSVLSMISAPMAKGLFQRAVAVSPSDVSPTPPDVATPFAAAMNMTEAELLAHLRSLSGEEIFQQQTAGGVGGLAAVDGHIVLDRFPAAIRQRINPVPLIAGCTTNEGPMLTELFGDNVEFLQFFEMNLSAMIDEGTGAYKQFLDSLPGLDTAKARTDRTFTDFFRATSLKSAQALADVGVPAWIYSFDLPSDHPYGPTHGSDVSLMFDSFDPEHRDGERIAFYRNTPQVRRVAAQWSAAVVRFMRDGDPNGGDLPSWDSYRADRRVTLVVDDPMRIEMDYDSEAQLQAFGIA